MAFKNLAGMSSRNVYDFLYEQKAVVLQRVLHPLIVPSYLRPKPIPHLSPRTICNQRLWSKLTNKKRSAINFKPFKTHLRRLDQGSILYYYYYFEMCTFHFAGLDFVEQNM